MGEAQRRKPSIITGRAGPCPHAVRDGASGAPRCAKGRRSPNAAAKDSVDFARSRRSSLRTIAAPSRSTSGGGTVQGEPCPCGSAAARRHDCGSALRGTLRAHRNGRPSYSGQPYHDLPECFAGWMARETAGSGEVFEPKTVVDRVDLTGNTQVCLPAIFDLETNEIIWDDSTVRRGDPLLDRHRCRGTTYEEYAPSSRLASQASRPR